MFAVFLSFSIFCLSL